MIYLVILLALIIMSFFNVNLKFGTGQFIVYIIATVVLILFAGLRVGGYDFDNYHGIFHGLSFGNNNDDLLDSITEPGFSLLAKLFKVLNLPFGIFILLFACVAVSLKSKYFLSYSEYPFFSLVIYFSVAYLIKDMGQIRHGLAMAIILVSFTYLFKKKLKGFLFFVGLAFMFHASAIIVLPAYWFAKLKIKPVTYALVSFILLPLLFFDLRPVFLSLIGYTYLPQIQSKATLYLYSDQFGSPLGFNISIVFRLVILGLLVLFAKAGNKRYNYYDDLAKLYFYGIILYIVFNSVSDFAIRTSDYFKLLDCIILPFFVYLGNRRIERSFIFSILLLYSLWSVYKLFTAPDFIESYLPYKTVFTSHDYFR